MVVVTDDLDLAAVDPALGVYFVGGDLCRRGYGRTRDRLGLGDHPDLDRALILRPHGMAGCQGGRAEHAAHRRVRNLPFMSLHGFLPRRRSSRRAKSVQTRRLSIQTCDGLSFMASRRKSMPREGPRDQARASPI